VYISRVMVLVLFDLLGFAVGFGIFRTILIL